MRQNWTKAECRQLREGNPGKLRKWIRDYADSLFTWVIYHSPLAPDQAAERTVRIFQEAFGQLNEYNPTDSSMYLWLIRRAESMFPNESPHPKQAPLPLLRALGLIGSVEIPDSLLENPAGIQLIQAALTEMDESERMVLLRRYHRIDRKASSEWDPRFSSDSLGDQLVRARYYFRRHLLAGIYAIGPDIGEFSPDSRISVFEKNLEKIFCSIPPALKLPEAAADEIEKTLLQQAEQNQAAGKTEGAALSRKTVWIAGTVIFLAAAAAFCYLLRDRSQMEPIPLPIKSKTVEKTEPSPAEAPKQTLSPEELKRYMARVSKAGSAGDMQELLKLLEEGPYPVQVAAAVFLGRIGDESAIGPLEKAARRWHPDPQEENPFLTAIEQIEQRLTLQARRQEEEALAARQQEALDAQQITQEETVTPPPPAEPNQGPIVQEEPQSPADSMEETSLDLTEEEVTEKQDIPQEQEEVWQEEEIPADQQEDYPTETEEPNETETEGTEEEYQTDDVQYIEEESDQTEY